MTADGGDRTHTTSRSLDFESDEVPLFKPFRLCKCQICVSCVWKVVGCGMKTEYADLESVLSLLRSAFNDVQQRIRPPGFFGDPMGKETLQLVRINEHLEEACDELDDLIYPDKNIALAKNGAATGGK